MLGVIGIRLRINNGRAVLGQPTSSTRCEFSAAFGSRTVTLASQREGVTVAIVMFILVIERAKRPPATSPTSLFTPWCCVASASVTAAAATAAVGSLASVF